MDIPRRTLIAHFFMLAVLMPWVTLCADDFDGLWHGEVDITGTSVFVQLDLKSPDDGKRSAVVTIPLVGSYGTAAREVRADDGGLVIASGSPTISVEIVMSKPVEDRSKATFDIISGPPQIVELPPAPLELQRVPRVRELPGASRHDGTLVLPGNSRLPITLVLGDFEGTEHALLDIPAQGLQGLYMLRGAVSPPEDPDQEGAIESHPEVRVWRLPIQVEAQLLIRPEGDSWSGEFRQGQFILPIVFERSEDDLVTARRRPQDPTPPFPYAEVECEIQAPGGHVLGGTLVIPGTKPGANGYPAVVLITGSGQQNRDEELMGHRPFRVLADQLARMGIASLRYDDRGLGASTGEFATATTFDFANDAAAALARLKEAPGVDRRRCGLAGHSEGGLVAAMVAAGLAPALPEADPAFVVSIAGTGVDGGAVLSDQSQRILLAMGGDEELVVSMTKAHHRLMDAIRDPDTPEDEIRAAMRELQGIQLEIQGETLDEEQRSGLENAGMAQMSSPWMKAFIRFDPATAWRQVGVPVLAVNGTLDLQVWHDLNLPAIEKAVREGGGVVEVVRFEGMNHMLQPATTGAPDEYGIIDITMDQTAMEKIGDWILATPRIPDVSGRRKD
ncbi:MAG: hypothetical protein CMJ67_09660 [Planctomycetaceae bacterium]|nr:hypothetical protein [Planctomycetaceae bacterium]